MNSIIVAKIVSSWYLLHGIIGSLSPKRSLDMSFQDDYEKLDGGKKTLLTIAVEEDMSGMMNAIAVTSHTLLFHSNDCSIMKAIGLGSIPIVLTFLKWILNDQCVKFGMPTYNAYMLCAIGSTITYCGLFDEPQIVLTGISYFFMTHGIIGILFPIKWASTFGITNMSIIDIVMHRRLASTIGGYGILLNRLLDFSDDDIDMSSALAMAVTPAFVNLFAMTLIWDDSKQVSLKKERKILWSILLGALIASTTFW